MSAPKYTNLPTIDPEHEGLGGRAWKVPMGEEGQRGKPDYDAGVATWLVHYTGPNAHPWWNVYVVGTVHLRPLPNVKPPHIQFPGATHEILFCALDPRKPVPDLNDWKGMAPLEPLDLVHQFIVPEDEQAADLTGLVIRHMIDAGASPDQDFRAYWRNAINKTAEHFRLGGHPEE